MAVLLYTAAQLVNSCRDIGMIPSASSLGSEDTDLLNKLNEGISTILVPRVLKIREEYFVARSRSTVGTLSRIRIPHRALYGKLRDLWFVDSSGDRCQMFPKEEEAMACFQSTGDTNPYGYFLEGDYVVMLPENNTSWSGSLEFVFFMRPNNVVASTNYINVSKVVSATTIEWTYGTTMPTAWVAGTEIDIHSPYSGAELKSWGLTIHAITAPVPPATPGQIEFHEKIDGTVFGTKAVAVGDYICAAEECALPALPREFHPLCARSAALYFAESVGDMKGIQFHGQILEQNFKDAIAACESRVEGKPIRLGGRRGFIGW